MSRDRKINKNEVEHIAQLCRIFLTEEEKEKFSQQLSSVLNYMDILNEVDTNNVIPTTLISPLSNVTRQDNVYKAEDDVNGSIKKNFPDSVGNFLRVPPVFEK